MYGFAQSCVCGCACSGGAAVLARCEEFGHRVWSEPPAPAVAQCVQHHQRAVLRGPGAALRHHQLQDIQRGAAGHPEERRRPPV